MCCTFDIGYSFEEKNVCDATRTVHILRRSLSAPTQRYTHAITLEDLFVVVDVSFFSNSAYQQFITNRLLAGANMRLLQFVYTNI